MLKAQLARVEGARRVLRRETARVEAQMARVEGADGAS